MVRPTKHGGGAEVGEEGGVEGGAEGAAAAHVRVALIVGAGGGDGGVVGGLEEEDLAREEGEDPAVDRAVLAMGENQLEI